MKRFLAVAALAAAYSINAVAAINLSAPAITGTGPFTWQYTATLTGDSRLEDTEGGGTPSSYFTIYDIGGIVSSIFAPIGWDYTSQNTGLTPVGQIGIPDAVVTQNITYKYIGVIGGQAETIVASLFSPVSLGNFGFNTTTNQSRVADYSYRGFNTNTNQSQEGQDSTLVPGLTRGDEVPEPATMGLMSGALAGLAFFARRRK